MGRPSAALARDTRQAILDAALDLFSERGYHATSVRALAAGAGVRESAIYHYFPSKEAVLDGLITAFDLQRNAVLDPLMVDAAKRPLAELLTMLVENALRFFAEPTARKFLRLVTGVIASGEVPAAILERHAGVPKQAVKLIEELQRAGKIRRDISPELFLLHLSAPMLMGMGALFGSKRFINLPINQFIKQHVAFMVRAASRAGG